jgi:hypothetical protein
MLKKFSLIEIIIYFDDDKIMNNLIFYCNQLKFIITKLLNLLFFYYLFTLSLSEVVKYYIPR